MSSRVATRRGLVAAGILALAVRVAYVLACKRHAVPRGDAFYYHYQANLLAQGKWFVNPFTYLLSPHHPAVAASDHPPLWILVLAAAAAVGVKGFLGQLLWACVVGAAGAVVVGLAAEAVAGPAVGRALAPEVGVAAALLSAVYPDFWINDGLLLSETLMPLVVGAVLLSAYRFAARPGPARAAAVGLSLALGALTRAELALLIPLLAVWMPYVARGRIGVPAGRRALEVAGAGAGAAVLVLGPWVGFNLARFREPVFVSSELGLTLAVANCDQAYHGDLLGYWSFSCAAAVKQPPGLDGPGQDAVDRAAGLRYLRAHKRRLPVVVMARLGRDLGVYRPDQQVDLEWSILGRARLPAWAGLDAFYAAVVCAGPAFLLLRRRRIPVWPLAALVVDALAAAALAFGQSRYRAAVDVVAVVLAAVVLAVAAEEWGALGRGRPSPG